MCDLGEQTLSWGRDIRQAQVCDRATQGVWGSAGDPRSDERCSAGKTMQKSSGNKVWLNTVFVEETQ